MESANGVLFSAAEKATGHPVCFKKVKKSDTHSYKRLDSGCLMPSEFYFHFKAAEVSSSVVKPLTWLESRKYYLIVMEKPEYSIDLFEFIKEFGTLSESAAFNILSQLVECSKLLHEAGICHRDIKDENILFDPATWKIKLIDFGSVTFATGSKYHSPQGTTDYFPPEFFLEDAYAPEPLTIWSIGAVFYIMLTGQWNFKKPYFKRSFKKEEKLSIEAVNLINRLLCSNPADRINFENLENLISLS